jgi:hypothetical protein
MAGWAGWARIKPRQRRRNVDRITTSPPHTDNATMGRPTRHLCVVDKPARALSRHARPHAKASQRAPVGRAIALDRDNGPVFLPPHSVGHSGQVSLGSTRRDELGVHTRQAQRDRSSNRCGGKG